jgi:hypothetical protein
MIQDCQRQIHLSSANTRRLNVAERHGFSIDLPAFSSDTKQLVLPASDLWKEPDDRWSAILAK